MTGIMSACHFRVLVGEVLPFQSALWSVQTDARAVRAMAQHAVFLHRMCDMSIKQLNSPKDRLCPVHTICNISGNSSGTKGTMREIMRMCQGLRLRVGTNLPA